MSGWVGGRWIRNRLCSRLTAGALVGRKEEK